jgi:hypothetical protein
VCSTRHCFIAWFGSYFTHYYVRLSRVPVMHAGRDRKTSVINPRDLPAHPNSRSIQYNINKHLQANRPPTRPPYYLLLVGLQYNTHLPAIYPCDTALSADCAWLLASITMLQCVAITHAHRHSEGFEEINLKFYGPVTGSCDHGNGQRWLSSGMLRLVVW